MHAIGNYIEKNSNKKVLYTTSETFSNEFIEISRKTDNKNNFDSIELFKNKYRGIDVLIVDDIQFLEKRVTFGNFNNVRFNFKNPVQKAKVYNLECNSLKI